MTSIKKTLAVALGLAAIPSLAFAQGNLAAPPATNLELAITGANAALSADTFNLTTGTYYRLTITSDGGAELLWMSPDLLNNAWINQIVVAGVEIKLWGDTVKGIEIGEGGPAEVQITFVPVRPGEYAFYFDGEDDIPGGTFIVE